MSKAWYPSPSLHSRRLTGASSVPPIVRILGADSQSTREDLEEAEDKRPPRGASLDDYRALVTLSSAGLACFAAPCPLDPSLGAAIVETIFSEEFLCIEANQSFAQLHGLARSEDALDAPLMRFIPRQSVVNEFLRQWVDHDFVLTSKELSYEGSAGQIIFCAMSLYCTIEGGQITKLWLVQRDIREHRRLFDEIKRAEAHYRNLVERPGLVLVRARPDGSYVYISPQVENIVGITPETFMMTPGLFATLLHPDDLAAHEAIYDARRNRSKRTVETQFRVKCKDGSYRWFFERQTPKLDGSGAVEFYDSVCFDIHERKQLESEQIHAQRMDIVGSLAHGIAHDFNNHLTALLGQLSLALTSLPEESPEYSSVAAAEKAALCCAEMTRHLLSFGRKSETTLVPVRANEPLHETGVLLRRLLPPGIELVVDAQAGDAAVQIDNAQLQQVLLNLAVNGRDAMPKGGTLRLAARRLESFRDDLRRHYPDAKADRYVEYEVSDTGTGIEPEVLPRIFEPFFSTKELGKGNGLGGSGLGLSMTYSIVSAHGGAIRVTSVLGEGSAFRFIIPETSATSERRASTNQDALPIAGNFHRARAPSRGHERVLVADDDELVRSMVTLALERHGYEVLTAVDGDDAVRIFEAHQDSIALAFIDQTMPRLSGREVINRLRNYRPSLPIVLVSGYPHATPMVAGELAQQEVYFLKKPFGIKELCESVRRLIDESALYTGSDLLAERAALE